MKLKHLIYITIFFILNSCYTTSSYLESRYIKVADEVLPSVVEIISIGLDDESKNRWFDFFQDQEDFKYDKLNTGIGSGVIFEKNDDHYYIITNAHVVGVLSEVSVLLANDLVLTGDVIGIDSRFDIAVIKIFCELELKVAKLNLSGRLHVGQFVAVLGSPMSYVQSISMGIISYIGRFGGPKENLSNYIQTDAAINHGNSGGPLVNMKGEIIGINTWISSPSSGNVGLGFAMPIENLYNSIRTIVDIGEVLVGWAGISSYRIPDTSYYADKSGAFINQVVIDSPAYNIGLKPGDIIVSLNGERIRNSSELLLGISLLQPSSIADFEIERGSDLLTITLIMGKSLDNVLETSKKLFPGIVLIQDNNQLFVNQVLPKSKGLAAGILTNDVIKKVNDVEVFTIESFYTLLKKSINKILIIRDNKDIELELEY